MDQDGPWVAAPASSCGAGVQRSGLGRTGPVREGMERLECLPTPLGGRCYQDCSVMFLNLSVKYTPKVQNCFIFMAHEFNVNLPLLREINPYSYCRNMGFSHHLFLFSIPQNTIIIYQNTGVTAGSIDLRGEAKVLTAQLGPGPVT